jgi:hypothetical protein
MPQRGKHVQSEHRVRNPGEKVVGPSEKTVHAKFLVEGESAEGRDIRPMHDTKQHDRRRRTRSRYDCPSGERLLPLRSRIFCMVIGCFLIESVGADRLNHDRLRQ